MILLLKIPRLSITTVIFHDFTGLENSLIKFHDFPGYVGTLNLAYTRNLAMYWSTRSPDEELWLIKTKVNDCKV